MKAIVFGGSGFLGSFVADELSQRGWDVLVFDKKESPHLKKNQKMIIGNILDRSKITSAIEDSDIVYNFAGLADLNSSIHLPTETIELNVMGNLNILEACKKTKVKRFIYASTVYVFSKKGSFYGISKRCSEKIIEGYSEEYGLNYTIIRYGSVYGTRADDQNRIYRIIKQALLENKITFKGDGEEEREYIHVKDAAKLSVDIIEKNEHINENITLTGVERFKYAQLFKMINEMMNNKVTVEYLNQEYQGHYVFTPYSFHPTASKKIICNPYIDFGQGLLETINEVHQEISQTKTL